MDISNLEKVLELEPKYRLKQANEAVFKNFISDWSEATFFTKDLRDKLNRECPLKIEADILVSRRRRGSPNEAAKNEALRCPQANEKMKYDILIPAKNSFQTTDSNILFKI